MCEYCNMPDARLVHFFSAETAETLKKRTDTCKQADKKILNALK